VGEGEERERERDKKNIFLRKVSYSEGEVEGGTGEEGGGPCSNGNRQNEGRTSVSDSVHEKIAKEGNREGRDIVTVFFYKGGWHKVQGG
jgi:hypothetical protein